MQLADLGYNGTLENYRVENHLEGYTIGRIFTEHKERYGVLTADSEVTAEITGNLRFTATNREDFPAVGDWVALKVYDAEMAIIHHIFPRTSVISRRAVGQFGEQQIIAVNIDTAFIVQAVDRDFSINRTERYLTLCNASKVEPVLVLSKTDLVDEATLNELQNKVKERIKDLPLIAISNSTGKGLDELKKMIEKGKTYCMLGSSGVGKSTLLNTLTGNALMKTGSISNSTHKGRHVTSHREMVLLESGGVLIDNPGMREVGIVDFSDGLETTFGIISKLAAGCRYPDCTHTVEMGCAVFKAVEEGLLDEAVYANFLKMEKEKLHFTKTVAEKRKTDKQFGKMLKNYKKGLNKNERE